MPKWLEIKSIFEKYKKQFKSLKICLLFHVDEVK